MHSLLWLIALQTSSRDVFSIAMDRDHYERPQVDGTRWECSGKDTAIASSHTSILPLAAASSSQIPTQNSHSEPVLVECDGCGTTEDTCKESDAIQCSNCTKWSHQLCMEVSSELLDKNEDGSWSCPACKNVTVWNDDKYVSLPFFAFSCSNDVNI